MADMLVKLYTLPDPVPLLADLAGQGVVIRRARAGEKKIVADFVAQNFSSAPWINEVEVAIGYQPPACFLAVHHGKLAGFGCYDVSFRNMFGPLGVASEQRGLGIGKALLLACLKAMADAGYAYATIGWVSSTEFYARAVGAVEIEGSEPGPFTRG